MQIAHVWAVGSVKARIKTWKYFDKVVPNVDILNLKEYLRIVCAICNKFKPPLITSVDEHCDIARRMLEKVCQPNYLQEKVNQDRSLGQLAREWVPLHECTYYDNFPVLIESYLRSLTFGIYQLNQAPNYTDQHMLNGDIYTTLVLQFCKPKYSRDIPVQNNTFFNLD